MVEKYAFVNLPKLRVLEMKNNPNLIHFGSKAFGHTVINLAELYLSNNAIEVFPESIAINSDAQAFSLKKLDISGNPLSCDCHLDWVKNIPEVLGDPKAALFIIENENLNPLLVMSNIRESPDKKCV